MKLTLAFRLRTGLGVLALASAVLVSAQDTSTSSEIDAASKEKVLQSMEKVLTTTAFVPGADFSKWPTMIGKHDSGIESAKTHAEFSNAVNGALQEFGFSHIVLYSPVMAQARTNRKMVGLGVRIQIEPNGIRVVWVFPDSPANEVGIASGDLITEADGKPVRQPGDLGGEEGSMVKVTVERTGEKKVFEVTRRTFSTDIPETLKWVDASTAMIAVPTFDLGYNKGKALDKVMKEAMSAKKLILDLRGNGGGSVVNLLHLSAYFLEKDEPLGTFVGRSLVRRYEEKTGQKGADIVKVADWATDSRLRTVGRDEVFKGQVVVLINGATGSASEMMAACLRDYRGAKLIGSKSAGAVLASYMWPIAEGFTLQFPVTDYVTIKGLRIEGNGLAPDVAVTAGTKFGEEDKAVVEAVKIMTKSSSSRN